MKTFAEIRDRIQQMPLEPYGNELVEILDEIGRFEADFHTLCREVASLSIDHLSKSYATTREFDRMCDDRGVVLPDIL